jgi:hypothetical protein
VEEEMKMAARGYILMAASWSIVLTLQVSSGLSSQPAVRADRGGTGPEPGDPPAYYDPTRRDWFIRQTIKAEPEGGSKSRLSMALLENTQILPINGPEVPALGTWASPLMDSLEKVFSTVEMNEPLIVAVTLSPKDEPSFAVTPAKKLSADVRQKITELLSGQTPPRPRFIDCHFAFVYKPKSLKDSDDPGIPAAMYPAWRESREYQAADLARRIQMLRAWSREHAIPLLAGAASQADPKYQGVRAFGADVLKLDTAGTIDVEKVTFRNPSFWRATMEMAQGNATIGGCQAFLFAANGELGKTRRLLQIMPSSAGQEQIAAALLVKLRGRIEGIEAMTSKRIEAGIRLFEQRQHDKAAAAFEAILKDNPSSAWAAHELLLTRFTMTRSNDVVKDYNARVYGLDPLYPSAPIHVDTGEGLYYAFLRMSLRDLFKDESKGREDAEKYAQIALDLGEYGYAGLMYWELFTRTRPFNDSLLQHFLYGVDRVGVPQIRALFKPELSAGLHQVEQARRKRMEEHIAYQSIQKKK